MNETHMLNREQNHNLKKLLSKYTFSGKPPPRVFHEFKKAINQALVWTSDQQRRLVLNDPSFDHDPEILAENMINGTDISTKAENRSLFFKELKAIVSPNSSEFKCIPLPAGNKVSSPRLKIQRVYYTWDDYHVEKKIYICPLMIEEEVSWDMTSVTLLDDELYETDNTDKAEEDFP